jgi:hypothetical protein
MTAGPCVSCRRLDGYLLPRWEMKARLTRKYKNYLLGFLNVPALYDGLETELPVV